MALTPAQSMDVYDFLCHLKLISKLKTRLLFIWRIVNCPQSKNSNPEGIEGQKDAQWVKVPSTGLPTGSIPRAHTGERAELTVMTCPYDLILELCHKYVCTQVSTYTHTGNTHVSTHT